MSSEKSEYKGKASKTTMFYQSVEQQNKFSGSGEILQHLSQLKLDWRKDAIIW